MRLRDIRVPKIYEGRLSERARSLLMSLLDAAEKESNKMLAIELIKLVITLEKLELERERKLGAKDRVEDKVLTYEEILERARAVDS